MTDPDFEALRAERNLAARKGMEYLAEAKGQNLDLLITGYNWSACYCACSTGGPCEHKWDGDCVVFENGSSASCSRCGYTAIGHDTRVGP